MAERFIFTRKNMADLLLSLNGTINCTPFMVLQDAWTASSKDPMRNEKTLQAHISTSMPPIVKKIMKAPKGEIGFSLNEIVSLGNQIEFTNFPQSTVQNWVKRDVKGLIGSPQLGKKYTIEQAAMLLIVEDLKATLDFESIRKILTLVFNNIDDRTDDIVNPTDLYAAYASIFDKIHHHSLPAGMNSGNGSLNHMIADYIKDECQARLPFFEGIKKENLDIVLNVLMVSALTVQSAYYQAATKKYLEAAIVSKGI